MILVPVFSSPNWSSMVTLIRFARVIGRQRKEAATSHGMRISRINERVDSKLASQRALNGI